MDHPSTLLGFMEMYPTEEACREALFEHRWKDGFCCPRCAHGVGWYLRGRGLFQCAACGYQASVTAGTLLHKSRTDLRKWMIAIWMLSSMKKPPSAAELARQLGVTHKTAWLIRRKISHAMGRKQDELLLRGMVELDESLIGGREIGSGMRGRASKRKSLVAVSAEETPQGTLGRAHIRMIPNAQAVTLRALAEELIEPGSTIRTDGFTGYKHLARAGYQHERRVQDGPRSAGELLPWVHTVISNFKRWQLDVFHGVSPKHLQAYLDEFCYRLNRREVRLDLFRRLLNRCLLYSGPITYWELIDA
ncbi:MAG: IS1595 family transposase [Thermoleophilia bacterium]